MSLLLAIPGILGLGMTKSIERRMGKKKYEYYMGKWGFIVRMGTIIKLNDYYE